MKSQKVYIRLSNCMDLPLLDFQSTEVSCFSIESSHLLISNQRPKAPANLPYIRNHVNINIKNLPSVPSAQYVASFILQMDLCFSFIRQRQLSSRIRRILIAFFTCTILVGAGAGVGAYFVLRGSLGICIN